MSIAKLAEVYGVEPKYVEVNNGVYTLTTFAGKACKTVKVPIMRVDDDIDTAQLPSHVVIANYVMGVMMAESGVGRRMNGGIAQ